MQIGFIGLGNMGQAMARNLLQAGHQVTVYNRTPSRAESLVAAGARLAETPGDAAQGEAVITMVADDRALEAVAFGDGGIIARLSPDAIHVSMSTISVALSERLTDAHREVGQVYVAAPVFGRPEAAAAAKLFVVAAGPAAALERCKPLFEAMGQRTFAFGDHPATANVVKRYSIRGHDRAVCSTQANGERSSAVIVRDNIGDTVIIEVAYPYTTPVVDIGDVYGIERIGLNYFIVERNP